VVEDERGAVLRPGEGHLEASAVGRGDGDLVSAGHAPILWFDACRAPVAVTYHRDIDRRRRYGHDVRSPAHALRALILCLLALGLAAPAASAQDQSADPGRTLSPDQVPVAPAQYDQLPAGGARVTPRQAIERAEETPEVRDARRITAGLRPIVAIANYVSPPRYQITYQAGTERPVEVHVDPVSGRVVKVYTGAQVDWLLARGEDASINSVATNPWLWVLLLAIFCALLVDPRRLRSWRTADVGALVAMTVSFALYSRAHLGWSVPVSFGALLYLVLRLGWIGIRGSGRPGPDLPRWASTRVLLTLLAVLVALRVIINLVDSAVIDVGLASVIGGDRFAHGQQLYVNNDAHGDVYGPVTYLFYGTFDAIFGSDTSAGQPAAAHAAAICFDLFTVLGLVLAGRRLRPGSDGTRLGAALAVAWCAYPITLFGLASNVNDGLVAALVLGAWLAVDSAPGRGALIGLAAAAKFAPAAAGPLFVRGTGPVRAKGVALAAGAALLAIAVPVALTLPDGGLRELWDTTLGYQIGRDSPFSIWGQVSLGFLQTVTGVLVVVGGLALVWWPRNRDRLTVAALAAAMLIAVQLPGGYWFYYYVVWFLPLALVAFTATVSVHTEPRGEAIEPAESALRSAVAGTA
jgi:hypothetical protein